MDPQSPERLREVPGEYGGRRSRNSPSTGSHARPLAHRVSGDDAARGHSRGPSSRARRRIGPGPGATAGRVASHALFGRRPRARSPTRAWKGSGITEACRGPSPPGIRPRVRAVQDSPRGAHRAGKASERPGNRPRRTPGPSLEGGTPRFQSLGARSSCPPNPEEATRRGRLRPPLLAHVPSLGSHPPGGGAPRVSAGLQGWRLQGRAGLPSPREPRNDDGVSRGEPCPAGTCAPRVRRHAPVGYAPRTNGKPPGTWRTPTRAGRPETLPRDGARETEGPPPRQDIRASEPAGGGPAVPRLLPVPGETAGPPTVTTPRHRSADGMFHLSWRMCEVLCPLSGRRLPIGNIASSESARRPPVRP